jgi:hypothetical protein
VHIQWWLVHESDVEMMWSSACSPYEILGIGGGENVNWLKLARMSGITVRKMKEGNTQRTRGSINFVGS